MHRRLKERLIGAAVLLMLAVILIPMILDDSSQRNSTLDETNIPAKPEGNFSSRLVPLQEFDNKPIPVATEGARVISEEGKHQKAKVELQTVTTELNNAKQPEFLDSRTTDKVGLTAWIVQLGSFASEANANVLNEKLRKAGYAAFVDTLKQESRVIYRVRIGPELLRSDAQALRGKLKKTRQLEGIVIPYP